MQVVMHAFLMFVVLARCMYGRFAFEEESMFALWCNQALRSQSGVSMAWQ